MEDKLKRHEELCKQIHETFIAKNNDYGDSVHELLEKLGPITLATRLGDKYNRICSLLTKGLDKQLVKSESILDTFLDLANYAIIGYVEMEQYLNNLSQYPIDKSKVNTDIILPASTTDNRPSTYSVITDETHCDIVDDENINTVKCPLQRIGDNQVAVVKRSKSIDIQTGDELFSFPLSNCLPIDTPSEYFRTQIPIDSNSSTVFVLVPSEVFKMENNTVKLYQKPFGVIPAKEVKDENKIMSFILDDIIRYFYEFYVKRFDNGLKIINIHDYALISSIRELFIKNISKLQERTTVLTFNKIIEILFKTLNDIHSSKGEYIEATKSSFKEFLLQKLTIHCDNNVVVKFDTENEVFDVYEK